MFHIYNLFRHNPCLASIQRVYFSYTVLEIYRNAFGYLSFLVFQYCGMSLIIQPRDLIRYVSDNTKINDKEYMRIEISKKGVERVDRCRYLQSILPKEWGQ